MKYAHLKAHMPPWRNRLARSAVNRKVGGSSPPGGAIFTFSYFDASPKACIIRKHGEILGMDSV